MRVCMLFSILLLLSSALQLTSVITFQEFNSEADAQANRAIHLKGENLYVPIFMVVYCMLFSILAGEKLINMLCLTRGTS